MAGPLTGYRIIEIAGIGPGPFAAMMLADMGAEVIRVERAQAVAARRRRPARRRHAARPAQHRHRPQEPRRRRDTLLELVENADALIEGFRPGVMERLGVGPDECLARNPKLVFGRMTGWGQDGPYAPGGRPRHQLHLARRCARPLRPAGRGARAAAQHGRRLRRRRHVPRLRRRVRAARGAAQRQGPGRRHGDGRRRGGADEHVLGVQGRWVRSTRTRRARTCSTPAPTSTTCTSAATASTSRSARSSRSSTPSCCASPGSSGDAEFAKQMDSSSWPHLKERLAEVFATKTRAEWCELMEHTDVCFAPVLTMSEAAEHPHNVERGTFIEVGGVKQPAPAPRFSRTKPLDRRCRPHMPASTPAKCWPTGDSPPMRDRLSSSSRVRKCRPRHDASEWARWSASTPTPTTRHHHGRHDGARVGRGSPRGAGRRHQRRLR